MFKTSNVDELSDVQNSWLNKSCTKALSARNELNGGPVLPVKGEKNVLITSALPFVNNVPHLGDIFVSALSADVFARYCRLCGWNTLYISGVNEHGPAVVEKALEEELTPQDLCDKYFEIHKKMYKWLNISFDMFDRTTSPIHTEFVHKIFREILCKGHITTNCIEQFLCQNCEDFLDDRFVVGKCPFCTNDNAQIDLCNCCNNVIIATELVEPRCKFCQHTLIIYKSEEIVLNPSAFETKLNDWINNSSSNWSNNARVTTRSCMINFIKKPCLSKDSEWGIRVPVKHFESKVFNDWFSTPISYMSITGAYTQNWSQWWMPNNETQITYYQFMAKNDIPANSIMFPICLFATERDYTFANHIIATAHVNCEHGTFASSRGGELFQHDQNFPLPADIFRFYLFFLDSDFRDISFNWIHLAITNNTELLKDLGGFFNSTLSMLEKYFGSIVPEVQLEIEELTLLMLVTRDLKEYINMMNKADLGGGLRLVLSISRRGNQYIESQNLSLSMVSPDKEIICTKIGLCCNLACLLAIIMEPFMPQTANKIATQMNIDLTRIILKDFVPMFFQPGHKMEKHVPLFKRTRADTFKCCIPKILKTNNSIERQEIQKSDEKILVVIPEFDLNHLTSIEEIEEAISNQSNLIQLLKQGNATKKKMKPYNKVLMDMKVKLKQLRKVSCSISVEHIDDGLFQMHLEKEIKYGKCTQVANNNNLTPKKNKKRELIHSPGCTQKKRKI